jgi:hypothetical protein
MFAIVTDTRSERNLPVTLRENEGLVERRGVEDRKNEMKCVREEDSLAFACARSRAFACSTTGKERKSQFPNTNNEIRSCRQWCFWNDCGSYIFITPFIHRERLADNLPFFENREGGAESLVIWRTFWTLERGLCLANARIFDSECLWPSLFPR